jgi:AcrR family transcriptional regulator
MPVRAEDGERYSAAERREALLDVAKALVLEHGPDSLTMGTIAEAAGVTRALVYKHFDNRNDVLVALYRRESAALDREMRGVVVAAGPDLEGKLRAFVDVILDSTDRYGSFFRLLRRVSTSDSSRSDRRGWDRRTVKYFAGLVRTETGLDEATATAATSLLLTPLQTLQAQVSADPSRRPFYVDTYIAVVLGALDRLRDTTSR